MTQVACLPWFRCQAKHLTYMSFSHRKNLRSRYSYQHFKEKEPRPGKEKSHASGPKCLLLISSPLDLEAFVNEAEYLDLLGW